MATGAAQVRHASRSKDFWRGVRAPFRGIATIAANVRLWPLAITPTVGWLVLLVATGSLAIKLYERLIVRVGPLETHGTAGTVGLWLTKLLAALALAVVVFVVSLMFVPTVSAPFMDRIAAKLDARQLDEPPLFESVWRSIRVSLAGLALFGLPQLSLAVLSALFSSLSWLFGAIAWFVSALALSYDALDWPLARRGLGVRARIHWLGTHKRLVAGLGLGVWVLSLVPMLSLLLLAGIVAGGVDLINQVEREEGPIG